MTKFLGYLKTLLSYLLIPFKLVANWAGESRIGMKIWSYYVDPPAIRGVWLVLLALALPVLGAAADRRYVRERSVDLAARIAVLGQANITCMATSNAWEARALIAEDKYANLVKREPLADVAVPAAPVAQPVKKPARRKVSKPAEPMSWPF